MFGIGPAELIIIIVCAIIFIGPKNMPETARKLGRLFFQVRDYSQGVQSSIKEAMDEVESQLQLKEAKKLYGEIAGEIISQVDEKASEITEKEEIGEDSKQKEGQ